MNKATPAAITDQPSLRSRLREGTRHLHERAEGLIGMPQSVADHERILATFYGFMKPWEHYVWPALGGRTSLVDGRRKTPLIEADLGALGWSAERIADIPRCTQLPQVENESAALGSLYVFEGATLGGQFVAKHVEERLGLTRGVGYSFHRCYGPRTGAMWNAFQHALADHAAESAGAADVVVAAACDTFEKLCEWFACRRDARQ